MATGLQLEWRSDRLFSRDTPIPTHAQAPGDTGTRRPGQNRQRERERDFQIQPGGGGQRKRGKKAGSGVPKGGKRRDRCKGRR